MRYLCFSDAHGASLKPLEAFMDKNLSMEDSVLNLGDLDGTIHEMPDFERKCENASIKLVNVPGNHERFLCKGVDVESTELRRQGTTSIELHDKIKRNPDAWHYLERLANSDCTAKFFLDESRFGKRYTVVAVHGALDGDLCKYPDCSPDKKALWARLKTFENYEKNSERMREEKATIMIKGHEHPSRPSCVSRYVLDDGRVVFYEFEPLLNRGGVRLFGEDELSVITLGAYSSGHIATIDTETDEYPIMSFYRL